MDDFNYPTAQRADTMMLQSFEKAGSSLKRGVRESPAALRVSDIPGAQACTGNSSRTLRFQNKPNLMNNSDIERSSPKRLIPREVNRPNDFNLSNSDIAGARPRPADFSTARITDPNNPVYSLPSTKPAPVPVPRKLNETNFLEDIPGTKPKPSIHPESQVRDTFAVSDIWGAKADTTYTARKRQSGKDKPFTNPSNEFNQPEYFRTNRCTNPLSPRYKMGIPGGIPRDEWEFIGEIPGNHPRPVKSERGADFRLLSLRTQDVPGAQPTKAIPALEDRREFRNPVDISDIPDAHPTVLHTAFHYKRTQRCLDPLNPDYPALGWKEKSHPASSSVGAKGVSHANQSSLDTFKPPHSKPTIPAAKFASPPRRSPPAPSAPSTSPTNSPPPRPRAPPPPPIDIPAVMSLPNQ